jgi:hypothetical protein
MAGFWFDEFIIFSYVMSCSCSCSLGEQSRVGDRLIDMVEEAQKIYYSSLMKIYLICFHDGDFGRANVLDCLCLLRFRATASGVHPSHETWSGAETDTGNAFHLDGFGIWCVTFQARGADVMRFRDSETESWIHIPSMHRCWDERDAIHLITHQPCQRAAYIPTDNKSTTLIATCCTALTGS